MTLCFGLKFLNSFIKATPLSPTVILRMTEVGAQRLRQRPTHASRLALPGQPMARPACVGLTLCVLPLTLGCRLFSKALLTTRQQPIGNSAASRASLASSPQAPSGAVTLHQVSGQRPSCEPVSQETPLVVEYNFDGVGHIKFFLAPKIEDEEVEDET